MARGLFLAAVLMGVGMQAKSALAATGYLSEGSIVAWGDSTFGPLNKPSGNTFTQIAAGRYHGLALRSNGSLAGWGSNSNGQINLPSGTFSQISAGCFYSVGLKTNGSLTAWGQYNDGELNVPSGTNFVQVAAGGYHGIALKSDGSLAGWGYNWNGQATVPSGNNFTQVAGGMMYCAAVKSDGAVACWGQDQFGETHAPNESDFTQVTCGTNHTVAIKSDGSLTAWGVTGAWRQTNFPSGNDYIQVSAGDQRTLALKLDGSLAGWGWDVYGQSTVPAGNDYISVAAGGNFSMALQGRGAYQDLLIQDVSRFTRCDTLLQRPVSASGIATINAKMDWIAANGRITAPTIRIQAGSELNLLLDGLNPSLGQSFQLFSTTSAITGTFAAVGLPELEPGKGWDTTHLYDTGTVQVVFAYLAGDANRDRSVNFADYQILEAHFGMTTGATWEMGDFDGDRAVTFADYEALETNYPKFIPEPASLCLLLGGGLILVRGRKAPGRRAI